MSNATIAPTYDSSTDLDAMLPVDPFRSLLVHFGMLLGVDDFQTVDAYHRGKMWLHSAWLHREGAIWGLGVDLNHSRNEIRAAPGLALDGRGREMFLAADACLNIAAWYAAHKGEPDLAAVVEKSEDGTVRFDSHVTIRFKGCLARQVPAMNAPCDGSGTTTAYSRVVETVELDLHPGLAVPDAQKEFHLLRLLFGLDEAVEKEGHVIARDQEVLDARAEILALPAAEQPAAYLEAFNRFAVLDEMKMEPAHKEDRDVFCLFPKTEPAALVLANIIGITLTPDGETYSLSGGEVDNTVRRVLLPTAEIQELLCGPICRCTHPPQAAGGETEGGETPSISSEAPVRDAGGPRIDPKVTIVGETITFTTIGAPLLKASVEARGVSVTSFDLKDGWIQETVDSVDYDVTTKTVTVALQNAPGGDLVRLIVKGTGAYPFLDRNRIPLAGSVGGRPGTTTNGNDFVSMIMVRS